MRRRLAVRQPFRGLAAALALHLAWGARQPRGARMVLRHRSYADPPDFGGVWGEIIAQIVRLHRRKRFHKQRFVQLMRQLQRSTAALPNGVVILNAQPRDHVVQPHGGAAAESAPHRRSRMRIENLLREPEFVRYLARQDFTNPVVIRQRPRRTVTCRCRSPLTGTGSMLLLVSDVSRQMRLEAVRRDFVAKRFARVALPPHRDFRLPGDSRPGSGARSRSARTGR